MRLAGAGLVFGIAALVRPWAVPADRAGANAAVAESKVAPTRPLACIVFHSLLLRDNGNLAASQLVSIPSLLAGLHGCLGYHNHLHRPRLLGRPPCD